MFSTALKHIRTAKPTSAVLIGVVTRSGVPVAIGGWELGRTFTLVSCFFDLHEPATRVAPLFSEIFSEACSPALLSSGGGVGGVAGTHQALLRFQSPAVPFNQARCKRSSAPPAGAVQQRVLARAIRLSQPPAEPIVPAPSTIPRCRLKMRARGGGATPPTPPPLGGRPQDGAALSHPEIAWVPAYVTNGNPFREKSL